MSVADNISETNCLRKKFNINTENIPVIALAGNPNTGKSTLFNNLTGLKQHTGNWPGKTVTQAQGFYKFSGKEFNIIDLPGTYSLLTNSPEEKIARDFICFGRPDVTVIVADATCLERNLNLVLQIMELTNNIILCLNLMDEAKRKNIKIDIEGLKKDLQIPVIPTVARESKGLNKLKEVIYDISHNNIIIKPSEIEYSEEIQNLLKYLIPELKKNFPHLDNFINIKWLALRLLEGDITIIDSLKNYFNKNLNSLKSLQHKRVEINGVI